MATVAALAPYNMPKELDFEFMSCQVRTRLIAAHEHLAQLRDDPGYFVACAKEYLNHRLENILDIHGNKNPALGTIKLWRSVIYCIFYEAHAHVTQWLLLVASVINLSEM